MQLVRYVVSLTTVARGPPWLNLINNVVINIYIPTVFGYILRGKNTQFPSQYDV